jgi:hypothetical protein
VQQRDIGESWWLVDKSLSRNDAKGLGSCSTRAPSLNHRRASVRTKENRILYTFVVKLVSAAPCNFFAEASASHLALASFSHLVMKLVSAAPASFFSLAVASHVGSAASADPVSLVLDHISVTKGTVTGAV